MNVPVPRGNEQNDSEILMRSHRTLNDFLCAFINHSLPTYNYYIQDRFFLEKLLNYEFRTVNRPGTPGSDVSVFFVGKFKKESSTRFALFDCR